jgi:hypothetical protein
MVATVAREWLESYANAVNRKTGRSPEPETLRFARRHFETWIFPVIGRRPIRELTMPELLEKLRRIEGRGRSVTNLRVPQRLCQVCDHALREARLALLTQTCTEQQKSCPARRPRHADR